MPYMPTNRRNNLVRLACLRWVREAHPEKYAEFLREAVAKVPKRQQGRPVGVVEASPRMTRRRQSLALQAGKVKRASSEA